jgi:hypothetical protein
MKQALGCAAALDIFERIYHTLRKASGAVVGVLFGQHATEK